MNPSNKFGRYPFLLNDEHDHHITNSRLFTIVLAEQLLGLVR